MKKTLQVEERRDPARYAIHKFRLSERLACRTVEVSRCAYRYQAKRPSEEPIVTKLQQLARRPEVIITLTP